MSSRGRCFEQSDRNFFFLPSLPFSPAELVPLPDNIMQKELRVVCSGIFCTKASATIILLSFSSHQIMHFASDPRCKARDCGSKDLRASIDMEMLDVTHHYLSSAGCERESVRE